MHSSHPEIRRLGSAQASTRQTRMGSLQARPLLKFAQLELWPVRSSVTVQTSSFPGCRQGRFPRQAQRGSVRTPSSEKAPTRNRPRARRGPAAPLPPLLTKNPRPIRCRKCGALPTKQQEVARNDPNPLRRHQPLLTRARHSRGQSVRKGPHLRLITQAVPTGHGWAAEARLWPLRPSWGGPAGVAGPGEAATSGRATAGPEPAFTDHRTAYTDSGACPTHPEASTNYRPNHAHTDRQNTVDVGA
jgi:hypothetical protein